MAGGAAAGGQGLKIGQRSGQAAPQLWKKSFYFNDVGRFSPLTETAGHSPAAQITIKCSDFPESFVSSYHPLFVSTAEAAFVAGLAANEINRVVDEKLVPGDLIQQEAGSRRVARLAAALARVYMDLEATLAARARVAVMEQLVERVHALDARNRDEVLRLRAMGSVLWTVTLPNHVQVDVTPQVSEAASRAREVDLADMLVTSDKELMGGVPCFAGTRVPVESVLASLEEGESMERLRASYPFLTEAHVDSARVYLLVHPKRGRPRKLSERNPALKPRFSKVIKPARP